LELRRKKERCFNMDQALRDMFYGVVKEYGMEQADMSESDSSYFEKDDVSGLYFPGNDQGESPLVLFKNRSSVTIQDMSQNISLYNVKLKIPNKHFPGELARIKEGVGVGNPDAAVSNIFYNTFNKILQDYKKAAEQSTPCVMDPEDATSRMVVLANLKGVDSLVYNMLK
jgi:hypothetical protein